MGEGLTQVGLLALLLLVVLPGSFFTLLALLDRMEHSLAPGSVRPAVTVGPTFEATAVAEIDLPDVEAAGADVIALRLTAAESPEPAAATG